MSPREAAERVLRAAVAGADPQAAVREALRVEGDQLRVGGAVVELGSVRRVLLAGAGKATSRMAAGALEVLGERVAEGALATVDGAALRLPGVEVWEAGHPVPDARGLAGAAEALRLARGARADDLVLCLLSGGASALWAAPPDGVSLGELRDVTDALLRSGAPIEELNTVRKHLSRIGGGGLARAAAPARVLTLAVSDVVGAGAEVIGSGPTRPDPTTYAEALEILGRYGVQAPHGVLRHLQAGLAGAAPETAKEGELSNDLGMVVVLSVRDALAAAAEEAQRLGLAPRVVTDRLEGDARRAGAEIAAAAIRARDAGEGPLALLWGGETTVAVRGTGRGGRCQELALAAARALEGQPHVCVGALGTDGRDGPTPAAGAVVDGQTLGQGRDAGHDPDAAAANNDSHPFLAAAGTLLFTGPTGTNVNDVVVAVVETAADRR